jgi:hypothetical protein
MDDTEVAFQRSVAAFIFACTPIEKHLLEGHPVTETNLELIATTAAGLQTAIQVWKRKSGMPINRPANLDTSSSVSRLASSLKKKAPPPVEDGA